MRKRKSPIVLVTALAIIVTVVAGFNFATSKPGGNPANQPPAPAEVPDVKSVGTPRAATPVSAVTSSVTQSMGAQKEGGPEEAAAHGGPPGRPGSGGPLILNPMANAKPEKPKPNSSSTSAQWYNDESAMSKQKG